MNLNASLNRLPEQKDREKFNVIFREYYPRLLAYGELFLDRDSVEDIVQDLMVYLWDNAGSITIHTSLESYLFRSVYRACLNRIKSDKIRESYKKNQTLATSEEVRYYDPEENDVIKRLFSLELGREIEDAIAALPEKCREVFKKSYIGNQKVKEIAAELNISERTAEAHIYSALKQLRNKLKDKFFIPPFLLP
jgi:RNA polymerase sigma-70 factor (ECF subfamily)